MTFGALPGAVTPLLGVHGSAESKAPAIPEGAKGAWRRNGKPDGDRCCSGKQTSSKQLCHWPPLSDCAWRPQSGEAAMDSNASRNSHDTAAAAELSALQKVGSQALHISQMGQARQHICGPAT